MKTKALSTVRLPRTYKDSIKVYDRLDAKQLEPIVQWLLSVPDPVNFEIDDDTTYGITQKANISPDDLLCPT